MFFNKDLPLAEVDYSIFDRIIGDAAFAQRCVHESLRLRPNTPKPKRHAETETYVGDTRIRPGAVVTINVALANVDERVFGPTSKEWNPDRVVPEGVPRWGLSFGAGAHQCPGRSVAAGFPVSDDAVVDGDHLVGLVAIMLREFVRRGVKRDPEHPPNREVRTERFNAWLSYPVIIERHSNPVTSGPD